MASTMRSPAGPPRPRRWVPAPASAGIAGAAPRAGEALQKHVGPRLPALDEFVERREIVCLVAAPGVAEPTARGAAPSIPCSWNVPSELSLGGPRGRRRFTYFAAGMAPDGQVPAGLVPKGLAMK